MNTKLRALTMTVAFALGSVTLSACASTGQGSTSGYDMYEISQAEIAGLEGQVNNLYNLVERLRPRWLTGDVVVYQGQSRLGDADYLRELGLEFATGLRYLDRSQATAQLPGLGSARIDGAIVIQR